MHDNKRKWQKPTQVDEEASCREQDEWHFYERGKELLELESLLCWRETSLDANIAQDKKTEEQECDTAHSPAKAKLRDEALNHDGQDNATDGGAGDDDAEG